MPVERTAKKIFPSNRTSRFRTALQRVSSSPISGLTLAFRGVTTNVASFIGASTSILEQSSNLNLSETCVQTWDLRARELRRTVRFERILNQSDENDIFNSTSFSLRNRAAAMDDAKQRHDSALSRCERSKPDGCLGERQWRHLCANDRRRRDLAIRSRAGSRATRLPRYARRRCEHGLPVEHRARRTVEDLQDCRWRARLGTSVHQSQRQSFLRRVRLLGRSNGHSDERSG